MSKCCRLLILLLLFISKPDAKGQQQFFIEGSIKDSLENPIDFSTITVQNSATSEIITYATTGSNGFYRIAVKTENGRYDIIARAFGYETKIVPFQFTDSEHQEFIKVDFVLTPMVTRLKEIVMKTNSSGIFVANDTVTFKADAFRDNTEKVTEDLLKKMPGIEVGKDGSVSVNGKKIEKILVDGDDLFNKNYSILSRNMSADLVDKIQVIDKYTENPLLKGVTNSEDKVLNIILKTSRKKMLFGNAAIAVGNESRYEVSANIISMLRKTKIFSFTNFNSTGKDPLPEVANNSELEGRFKENAAGEVISTGLIELMRFKPQDFNRDRINFNQAKLGSLSFITRPSKSLTVTGLGYLFTDKTMLNQQNNYQYFTSNSVISIKEINHYKQSPFLVNGWINLVYNPAKSSRFEYTFNNEYSARTTDAILFSDPDIILNKGEDKSMGFNHKAIYTNRIKEKKNFMIEGYYTKIDKGQKFDRLQSQPTYLPFTSSYYQNLFQSVSCPLSFAKISAKYIKGDGFNNLTIASGVHYKTQQLISELDTLSVSGRKELLSDSFKNSIQLRQVKVYAGLDWLVTISPSIQINTQLNAEMQGNNIINKQNLTTLNKPFFRMVPRVGLKWKNGNHIISTAFTYNTSLPEINDLATGYVLSDYRTLQKGSDVYGLSGTGIVLLDYFYANWSRQVLIFLNFIRLDEKGILNRRYDLSDDYDIIKYIPGVTSQRNSFYTFGFNKLIPVISSSVKVKANLTENNYENQLNDSSKRRINTQNKNVEVSLRTAWKRFFNFGIGSAYNHSKSMVADGSEKQSFVNKVFTNYVDLTLKISKQLNAKINAEQYYFDAVQYDSRSYVFLDFSMQLFTQDRVSIAISGRNLLNKKSFFTSAVNDYSSQVQQYRLLPRYMMVEMNYRF